MRKEMSTKGPRIYSHEWIDGGSGQMELTYITTLTRLTLQLKVKTKLYSYSSALYSAVLSVIDSGRMVSYNGVLHWILRSLQTTAYYTFRARHAETPLR